MIWLLIILQIIFVKIGWWVYNAYYTQPKYNHPPIFWNPLARTLLVYGPLTGILGLVITAFFLTSHPWLFLFFTLAFWVYCGHKRNTALPGFVMPVLTEDGIKLEEVSAEEFLKDIRSQKRESSPNNNSQTQED